MGRAGATGWEECQQQDGGRKTGKQRGSTVSQALYRTMQPGWLDGRQQIFCTVDMRHDLPFLFPLNTAHPSSALSLQPPPRPPCSPPLPPSPPLSLPRLPLTCVHMKTPVRLRSITSCQAASFMRMSRESRVMPGEVGRRGGGGKEAGCTWERETSIACGGTWVRARVAPIGCIRACVQQEPRRNARAARESCRGPVSRQGACF